MTIAYMMPGEGGEGEGVPLDERIEAFSYLVEFLVTFAPSVSDTRSTAARFGILISSLPSTLSDLLSPDGALVALHTFCRLLPTCPPFPLFGKQSQKNFQHELES